MELATERRAKVAQGEAQDAGTPTLKIPEANDDDLQYLACLCRPRDGDGGRDYGEGICTAGWLPHDELTF